MAARFARLATLLQQLRCVSHRRGKKAEKEALADLESDLAVAIEHDFEQTKSQTRIKELERKLAAAKEREVLLKDTADWIKALQLNRVGLPSTVSRRASRACADLV